MAKRLDELKFRVTAHSRDRMMSRASSRKRHEIEVDAADHNDAAKKAAEKIGSKRSIIIRKITPAAGNGWKEPERKRVDLIVKGHLTAHAKKIMSPAALASYRSQYDEEKREHASYVSWIRDAMKANAAKKAEGNEIENRQARGHSSFGHRKGDAAPVFHAQWDRMMNKGFVNEVSKSKLLKYISKAVPDHANLKAAEYEYVRDTDPENDPDWGARRRKGINTAARKLAGTHVRVPAKEETEIQEASFRNMIRTHVRASGIQSRQFHAMNDPELDPTEKRYALKRLHRQMQYARKKTDAYADRIRDSRFEEVEQVDELSKGTLGRYAKKAFVDYGTREHAAGRGGYSIDKKMNNIRKIINRENGVKKAVGRLAREEAELDEKHTDMQLKQAYSYHDQRGHNSYSFGPGEKKREKQLNRRSAQHRKARDTADMMIAKRRLEREEVEVNELSKGTLGRYVKKAAISSMWRAGHFNNSEHDSTRRWASNLDKKRKKGINMAVDRLAKEDVVNELSKGKLLNYVGSASMDKSFAASDIGADNVLGQTGHARMAKKKFASLQRKHANRSGGIQTAAMKLGGMTKEKGIGKRRVSWIKVPASEETVSEARVEHNQYVMSHGKAPRGNGNWMFSAHKNIDFDKHKEGHDFVSVNGSYGVAKKKAQEWAKSKKHSVIHAMP